MSAPFDLPFIMTKLRAMVEQYETLPMVDDHYLNVLLRITYQRNDGTNGITLVVGTEPSPGLDDDD